MNEPVRIGNATLYLGDCSQVMPMLDPVDAVVMDPPYEINTEGAGNFRKTRSQMNDIKAAGLDKGFDHTFLGPDLCRSVVVFCHNDQVSTLLTYLESRFDRACLCFWHKSNSLPLAHKHYRPDTEIYIHAWMSDGHPVGTLAQKARFIVTAVGKSAFDHPTVKPLAVMDKIIANTNGQTVLDPYMGTGTTGVACLRQGRSFIGIEKNPAYFEIACGRLEEAWQRAQTAAAQGDMLAEPDAIVRPQQKAMVI